MKWVKRILASLGISGFVLGLGLVVATLLYLRFFGLPGSVKQRLLSELEKRGVVAEVDRLLLDPSGALLAENLTVYRTADRQAIWVRLDRVRLGFAWFSWWQDRPFLEEASVSNANIRIPVGKGAEADLQNVSAYVRLTTKSLQIKAAQARLLSFQFEIDGTIELNGLPERKVVSDEELVRRAEDWNKMEAVIRDVVGEGEVPVRVTLDLSTKSPDSGKINLEMAAKRLRFRGVQIPDLLIRAGIAQHKITLQDFSLKLARGELRMDGSADLVTRTANVEFLSNLDFSSLGSALGERVSNIFNSLSFEDLPQTKGRLTYHWGEGSTIALQADLNWGRFTYRNASFLKFVMPIGYDGKRLLIPEASLVTPKGALKFDAFYDESKPVFKAKVENSLDPTVFIGLFGDGVDRFLQSLEFRTVGPQLKAAITGQALKTSAWTVGGTLLVKDFSYKKVSFLEAGGDFTFTNETLTVPNLLVKKAEGQGAGGFSYNFHDRWVRLNNLRTNVNLRETAPVFGGKFEQYVQPYRFYSPPVAKVDGLVDLQDTKPQLDTDLVVETDGPNTLEYVLFQIPFQFKNPKARLHFKNHALTVDIAQAGWMDGSFSAKMNFDLSKRDADYQLSLLATGADFQKCMAIMFNYEKASGALDFAANLYGQLGHMDSMKGGGEITIKEGYIMSIPFLGGLSELLSSVIPNFAMAKAGKAHSTYTLDQGRITSKDIEISSAIFTVIGSGNYDYVGDNLDMDMRVNAKGVAGVLLFPVSKLFEYKGTGSLKKPLWTPKVFGPDDEDAKPDAKTKPQP